MYVIEFYEEKNGASPVWDYLEEMRRAKATNKSARIEYNQMIMYIELLKQNGTNNNANITKKLNDDLWELRPGNNRILYYTHINGKFVLLHCFRKKTQKTPEREIEKAKREIKDYLQTQGGNL